MSPEFRNLAEPVGLIFLNKLNVCLQQSSLCFVVLGQPEVCVVPISMTKSSKRQFIAGSVRDFVTTPGNKLRDRS